MDEALEAKKGFVTKKLGQLRKSQLLTLARAFNLDVSEDMRRVYIIDETLPGKGLYLLFPQQHSLAPPP